MTAMLSLASATAFASPSPNLDLRRFLDHVSMQPLLAQTPSGGYGPGGGTPASPSSSVQFNNSGAFGGSSTFTWADGTNSAGVFMGPPSAGFSTNIAPLANAFNLAELQVNRHVLVGGSDVGATSIQNFLQSDKDLSLVGTDTVVDATNAVSGSIVGIFATTYYNVPVGQTNANLQTGFEGQVFAYGAGSSGASGGAAVFEASGAQNTGTGTIANLVGFYATQNFNTGGGTVHNSYGFHALDQATVGDTLNAAFHADPQTAGAHNYAFYNTQGKSRLNLLSADTYATVTDCAVNSVSPAACGAACSGAFVVPTTTTTYTVSTTCPTTNASHIFLFPRTDNSGLPSAPTCAAPAVTSAAARSAHVNSTSFTFALPSTTGATCWDYWIVSN